MLSLTFLRHCRRSMGSSKITSRLRSVSNDVFLISCGFTLIDVPCRPQSATEPSHKAAWTEAFPIRMEIK